MPTVAQPYTPPATQGEVISMYAQGKPKRKIARDLGIARNTVDSILARYSQNEPNKASRVARIVPKAYDAVDKAVTRGDAKIALDFLKATDLAESKGSHYTINADNVLVSGLDMMPLNPNKPIAAPATGTEAGANPTPNDIGLSSRTNFSQILANTSTDDLLAELARRGVKP